MATLNNTNTNTIVKGPTKNPPYVWLSENPDRRIKLRTKVIINLLDYSTTIERNGYTIKLGNLRVDKMMGLEETLFIRSAGYYGK